ncbi:AP-1 complex-associated regulatory protein-like isoform X2 [Haliotis rufescens]|uniref:AP-1 complex-associated regulatory protein-like isoform X2 n=1 Tax=Haliotis rufescens TaxID=6454 RepID=UPI00201EDCF4|nr:AP-1 complex-associated regulatory protein-like isoform X2 [Haliotis rufescens]
MIVVSFNMGNCLRKCCGLFDKRRKYLKTRYNVERDFSIEFENLMDDEPQDDMNRPLTERERLLLSHHQYDAIVHEQKQVDAEIDAKLAQQEEEIEREEEAYYEAKREAARITKLQRAKEAAAKKNATTNGPRSWLGDEDDWEVAGGEDDFEIFLASVKARSLAARAQLRQGSGDGQSSSSSTAHRDKTEGSSLDLEWEHEAGVVPQLRQRSSTEENLVGLTKDSPMNSNDLEWDNDFVSAEELEKEQLISHSNVR